MSEYLCEELIVEIFTRLPPKSLLRFRSVSKSLRSCIDSPDFIRMHASRSPERLAITHAVRENYIEELGYDAFCTVHAQGQLPLPLCGYIGVTAHNFPHRNLNIVGSCNGIICLFEYGEGKITLWNPSIMRQLILPDCPRRRIFGIGIGIGFDPISDDNKIVSIPLNGHGNGENTFVYSMKTRAWCLIASPMPLYTNVLSRSCYLNGVLHWVVERLSTYSDDEKLRYIMTFDLRTHVFGMIGLPKLFWETYKLAAIELAAIEGSLAVISIVSDYDCVLVRRDASWGVIFKSHRIEARKGVRKVVELTNNGGLLLDSYREGFQVYNRETGVRSTLVNFNDASRLFDMDTFVETLQLFDIGTAYDVNQPLLQEKGMRENLATGY